MTVNDINIGASSTTMSSVTTGEMVTTASLEDLQTNEQRRVLDTVAQVRKCGLESVLDLPQLVVCGDQSAGKSSLLEALTEIPFPRNDNLCTRFATEICLRRAHIHSLTIKCIPDEKRPSSEKDAIRKFAESILDFGELPRVMELAMSVMGIAGDTDSDKQPRAFARDVLSIVIEGPTRPQLTLVDIPGLIANETKGVTKEDVRLVDDITNHYISQKRTICLPVVSATNDYANQKILTKVKDVDPKGERTLGIITKPDSLPSGSGAEASFIGLAKNEDIFFKLGWHVIKNRKFEETSFSLLERNSAEKTFFNTSNFKSLPKDCVGIDALRCRLSLLLFQHIKNELPRLKEDLGAALKEAQKELNLLGSGRSSPAECRAYLAQLSLAYWDISKSAVNGNYENEYFYNDTYQDFDVTSDSTIRRTRAVVQKLNADFARDMDMTGHKYRIIGDAETTTPRGSTDIKEDIHDDSDHSKDEELKIRPKPQNMTHDEAIMWIKQVLLRNRGKELIGNYNPLLISELLWEQATNWQSMARNHIENITSTCSRALRLLLQDQCPDDVQSRIWSTQIVDVLERRTENAVDELKKIIGEVRSHPINHNHYYTETIANRRREAMKKGLTKSIEDVKRSPVLQSSEFICNTAVAKYANALEADMESFSCNEALECLLAIYKVQKKVFVANVNTQVIERHIVNGLETIFSPVVVNGMSDEAALAIASEPASTKNSRDFLTDRIEKLQAGQRIFKTVMGSA